MAEIDPTTIVLPQQIDLSRDLPLDDPQKDVVNEYYQMLLEIKDRPLPISNMNLTSWDYQPRLPHNGNSNSLLPIFEPLFVLTHGILTDQILPPDPEKSELRPLISQGLIGLMLVTTKANRGRMDWHPAIWRRLPNSDAAHLIRSHDSRNRAEVDYRPRKKILNIIWNEYSQDATSTRISPSKLIGEFRLDTPVFRVLGPNNYYCELAADFEIRQVPWVEDGRGGYKLGVGRNLIDEYLGPNRHHVPILKGHPFPIESVLEHTLRALKLPNLFARYKDTPRFQ